MPTFDDALPVLSKILDRVEQTAKQDRLPVLVYDLDSTLFDTAGRNQAIFTSFVDDFRHLYPELVEYGERAIEVARAWNIVDRLKSLGFEQRDALNELRGYWAERFFTDQWLGHDFPMPGAAHFVTETHKRGAFVYYMTGRHINGMHEGTVNNLVRDGFPCLVERVSIHLKPNFEMADKVFKRAALEGVRSMRGTVIATFENEPANANLFQECFPDAMNVLVDTVHSTDAETPTPELAIIPDFAPGTDWTQR